MKRREKMALLVGMLLLIGFFTVLTHEMEEEQGYPKLPDWLGYFTDDGALTAEDIQEAESILAAGGTVPETDHVLTEGNVEVLKQLFQLGELSDKYNDPAQAEADGYVKAGPFVPHMGQHFILGTATVEGQLIGVPLSVTEPVVLFYDVAADCGYQLAGVEWNTYDPQVELFGIKAADWPVHEASAHYADGSEIPLEEIQGTPPAQHPETGAPLAFWHLDMYTFHVWIWKENPDGLFAAFNPEVSHQLPEGCGSQS